MENEYIPFEYDYDILGTKTEETILDSKYDNTKNGYRFSVNISKSPIYYFIKITTYYTHTLNMCHQYSIEETYRICDIGQLNKNAIKSICSELLYQQLSKLSYWVFKEYRFNLKVLPHITLYHNILIPPIVTIYRNISSIEELNNEQSIIFCLQ